MNLPIISQLKQVICTLPTQTSTLIPLVSSVFHEGSETLTTHTETLSLIGKLMVPIPHSEMKIFSGAGVAGVHRRDLVLNDWNPGPTFTVGVNYNFTEHIMGEIAGNFTAGYGESQLSPVDTYYPFLYSVAAHLIYRF